MSMVVISQCRTTGMQHRRNQSHYLWIRRKEWAKNPNDCLLGFKLRKIMPCRVDADPERTIGGFWECHGMLHLRILGFGASISCESQIPTNTGSWWDRSDHSGVEKFTIGSCLPPRVIFRQD